MKLGAITIHHKRNTIMLKKFEDDVMSGNCDAITMFPFYDQFGVIWKLDNEDMVCKAYIFISSSFLS